MSVRVSNKQYKNFGNCVFLDNGLISLGVTVDLGPRIIYFARRARKMSCLRMLNAALPSLQVNTAAGWLTAVTGYG